MSTNNTQIGIRCKVAAEWMDGGITPRYSESSKWMPENEALDEAAGLRASGKYFKIEVITQRKESGRWSRKIRIKYPTTLPAMEV